MTKQDLIDKQILQLIGKKPDITEAEIALELGLDANEVKNRIKHLTDTRVKIMIVDDERDAVVPLKIALESEKYSVVEAYNGYEAIKKARVEIPDLILLDITMPGMDGYEVCSRLRNDALTEKIPIIILTAKDKVNEKIEGLNIGADDYVTKPFNLNELKARVRSVLRRSTV